MFILHTWTIGIWGHHLADLFCPLKAERNVNVTHLCLPQCHTSEPQCRRPQSITRTTLLQRRQNCEDYINEGVMEKKKRDTERKYHLKIHQNDTHHICAPGDRSVNECFSHKLWKTPKQPRKPLFQLKNTIFQIHHAKILRANPTNMSVIQPLQLKPNFISSVSLSR